MISSFISSAYFSFYDEQGGSIEQTPYTLVTENQTEAFVSIQVAAILRKGSDNSYTFKLIDASNEILVDERAMPRSLIEDMHVYDSLIPTNLQFDIKLSTDVQKKFDYRVELHTQNDVISTVPVSILVKSRKGYE